MAGLVPAISLRCAVPAQSGSPGLAAARHNLNTAINKIREVLGDSAESPRFVETLPRRGYRFVAPVEGKKSTVLPASQSRRRGRARRGSDQPR